MVPNIFHTVCVRRLEREIIYLSLHQVQTVPAADQQYIRPSLTPSLIPEVRDKPSKKSRRNRKTENWLVLTVCQLLWLRLSLRRLLRTCTSVLLSFCGINNVLRDLHIMKFFFSLNICLFANSSLLEQIQNSKGKYGHQVFC